MRWRSLCLKLQELSNFYYERKQKEPNKYKYADLKVIENYSIDMQNYDVNVRYIYADGKYRIFVFVGKDNKLEFHGLYRESVSDLNDEYKVITSDMMTLSVDKFFDKYYEILKENI